MIEVLAVKHINLNNMVVYQAIYTFPGVYRIHSTGELYAHEEDCAKEAEQMLNPDLSYSSYQKEVFNPDITYEDWKEMKSELAPVSYIIKKLKVL